MRRKKIINEVEGLLFSGEREIKNETPLHLVTF